MQANDFMTVCSITDLKPFGLARSVSLGWQEKKPRLRFPEVADPLGYGGLAGHVVNRPPWARPGKTR